MTTHLDNWITGHYGDDNDGPLLICGECGCMYPEDNKPGGENECRCTCEVWGEYRKYCECIDCVIWRDSVGMGEV